jgi:type VI secretion system protein ImpG
VVTPKLLCTNRELTLEIPIGGDSPEFVFHPDKIEYLNNIRCISRISKPRYRKRDRNDQLELLTHISVSQLCFDNCEKSIEVLKNTLSSYNIDTQSDNPMIDKGIQSVKVKTITKRNPNSLKQGFCQGLEYTLTVDEQYFTENNMYLFARILQYFLQHTCSINSFVQMVLETKQRGVLKRWKPMLGAKKIL